MARGDLIGQLNQLLLSYSKFDEDVQIAMAISSSIADQDSMARGDLIGQLNQPENSGQEKKKSRKKKK